MKLDSCVAQTVNNKGINNSSNNKNCKKCKKCCVCKMLFLTALFVFIGLATATICIAFVNMESLYSLGDEAALKAVHFSLEDGDHDDLGGSASVSVVLPNKIPSKHLRIDIYSGSCDLSVSVDEGDTMYLGEVSLEKRVKNVGHTLNGKLVVELSFDDLGAEAISTLRNVYSRNMTSSDVQLHASCSSTIVLLGFQVIPFPWTFTENFDVALNPVIFPNMDEMDEQDKVIETTFLVKGLWPEQRTMENGSSFSDSEVAIDMRIPVPNTIEDLSISIPATVLTLWTTDEPTQLESRARCPQGTPDILAIGIPESRFVFLSGGVVNDVIEVELFAIQTTMPGGGDVPSLILEEALSRDSSAAVPMIGMWFSSFLVGGSPYAYLRSAGADNSILFYILGFFRLEREASEAAFVDVYGDVIDSLTVGIDEGTQNHRQYYEEEEEVEEESEGEGPNRGRRGNLLDSVAPNQLIEIALFDELTNVEEGNVVLSGTVEPNDDGVIVSADITLSDRDGVVLDADFGLTANVSTPLIQIDFSYTPQTLTSAIPDNLTSTTTFTWEENNDQDTVVTINSDIESTTDGVLHSTDITVTFTASTDSFTISGSASDVTEDRTIPYTISGLIMWTNNSMGYSVITIPELFIREGASRYLFNVDWDHAFFGDSDGSLSFVENGEWIGTTTVNFVYSFVSESFGYSFVMEADVLPSARAMFNVTGEADDVQLEVVLDDTVFIEMTDWREVTVTDNTGVVSFAFDSDIIGSMDIDLSWDFTDDVKHISLGLDWSALRPILFELSLQVHDSETAAAVQSVMTVPSEISFFGRDIVRIEYQNFDFTYGGTKVLDLSGNIGAFVLNVANGDESGDGVSIEVALDFSGDVQPYGTTSADAWDILSWFTIEVNYNTNLFRGQANYFRAGRGGNYQSGSYVHVPSAYLRVPDDFGSILGEFELLSSFFFDHNGKLDISIDVTESTGSTNVLVTVNDMYIEQDFGNGGGRNLLFVHTGIFSINIADDPSWGVEVSAETSFGAEETSNYMYMKNGGVVYSSQSSVNNLRTLVLDQSIWNDVDAGKVVFAIKAGMESSMDDVCNCIASGASCTASGFPLIGTACTNFDIDSKYLESGWFDVAVLETSFFVGVQNSAAQWSVDFNSIDRDPSYSSAYSVESGSFFVVIAVALASLFQFFRT
eukprot:m.177479 g.177479  ORF g.177479 m.177479 type:complete len:1174 (+) comp13548_c1_seq2:1870-5391(+)